MKTVVCQEVYKSGIHRKTKTSSAGVLTGELVAQVIEALGSQMRYCREI